MCAHACARAQTQPPHAEANEASQLLKGDDSGGLGGGASMIQKEDDIDPPPGSAVFTEPISLWGGAGRWNAMSYRSWLRMVAIGCLLTMHNFQMFAGEFRPLTPRSQTGVTDALSCITHLSSTHCDMHTHAFCWQGNRDNYVPGPLRCASVSPACKRCDRSDMFMLWLA